MHRGAQLARLAQQLGLYQLDGERRHNSWGAWYQTVLVVGQRYVVGVEPGKRVRIAFKPRGTYGRQWHGLVRSSAGRDIWSGQVNKSTGVFTLLRFAGLLPSVEIGEAIVAWGEAMRAGRSQ